MPEKPPSESEAWVTTVVEMPADREPLSRPGPQAAAPKWSSYVHAWLSSEFVNGQDYFRFAPSAPLYEAAIWPLGLTFMARTDAEHSLTRMADLHFDQNVKRATQLPWRYSGLHVRLHPRREEANLTIRNIGNWGGEPRRYQEIVSTLARRLRGLPPDFVEHVTYAITPFCIIGQTWFEELGSFPPHPVNTSIALFYTFETFIQECLALDARRAGIPAAEIVAAYEHRYDNVTWHPNLMLRDPRQMRLGRYANPAIDWSLIAATPENVINGTNQPGWQARSQRKALFDCRLQTHLMVAIAVAFHGLATFANGHASSPLVRTATSPPDLDALAPHWLGHVLGDYDHAAACYDLLQSLGAHYQQDLAGNKLRGMPMPPYRSWGDEVEETIVRAGSPYGRDCLADDPVDIFRWNLFDATLDDAAVTRWGEDAGRWVRGEAPQSRT